YKERYGTLKDMPGTECIKNDELVALDIDILVPAAYEHTINGDNAGNIKASIVAEAANAGISYEANKILHDRGILVMPDILVNAGGLVISYFEWVQDRQEFFWQTLEIEERFQTIMVSTYRQLDAVMHKEKISMRTAALKLGIGRIAEAMKYRGLCP
ncbi:glutamate dehydrogenase, partial [bacterium]|nr:glutamate dehydrogenase [bacterium]